MNITEFAEQIVFGKTLADKLLVPARLTHGRRSMNRPNVESLVAPGRPIGLEMRHTKGENAQPPSDSLLEKESARGQLLHFLANHELLATELMALTLLKFPDAPHAFRAGVLVTLQEEQEHTRMYLRRMEECGVEFGSFPLSGQFWRFVEPMQSPLDFVSRLSLTFEQANLDYSLHFATVFRRIGDLSTADLLQKIYEDEIGHVQHGLHWFRQWKAPNLSDWDAYQASLEFPLSPQRGRGPRGAFNRAGRRAAGLTDDFINAMEVFRQSRGRAPTVRWFDPAAEAELAGDLSTLKNSEATTSNQTTMLDQLGIDLELVMLGLAKQDDVLFVRRLPSQTFRKRLIDVGFELPELVTFDDRSSLANRKLHDFVPWAWTPRNHEIAAPLSGASFHAPPPWRDDVVDLSRKSWGANRLRDWLCENENESEISFNQPDGFVSSKTTGISIGRADDIPAALTEISNRGYEFALFKQDLATSGRGQRRLSCTEPLTLQDEAWLRSVFKSDVDQQPIGVIEPELNRILDLSFLWQLSRDANQPEFLGWTRPMVTQGRRFAGTRLGTALSSCDQETKRFLLADKMARLNFVVDWLATRLTPELLKREFSGYFGVDALVCRSAAGELQIKPMVELNARTTMGHIALKLKKRLAPGAEAMFRIFTKSEWEQEHEALNQIPYERSSDGWTSGVIWMGEVDAKTKLIPALLIGRQVVSQYETRMFGEI